VTPHRQKQVKQPIVRSVQYPALKGPLIPLQTESPFSKTFWQKSGKTRGFANPNGYKPSKKLKI
jgi:hypothetical protein